MVSAADAPGRLGLRRRPPRRSPLRARRIGAALDAPPPAGVDPATEFPGLDLGAAAGRKGRVVSGGVSLLLHAALLGGLALAAWVAPVEEIEEIIKLERVKDEAGAAPRVVAERATPVFDPKAMALAPQIVNPVVVQQRAPPIEASKIDVESLSTVQAPKTIERAATVVEEARAYQSIAPVVTSPVAVEGVAPAMRGPVEHVAPVGVTSGPRRVASVGDGVGLPDAKALGSASSVKEGIVTGRDVHGAPTGVRAEVHWAVGEGNLRGSGGSGTGPGSVSFDDCQKRPEVIAYMARIKQRMLDRWALPPDVPGNLSVELRFGLDPAGTVTRAELVRSADARLGQSAVDALRSASPFDHMSDRVRCLADGPLIGTFTNPVQRAAN
jgi:outer membrane biosynthesis protein TonB